MSGFLLHTYVLSEFSRSAIPPDQNVKRWMESSHPDSLVTGVLSIGEIRKGIEHLAGPKVSSAALTDHLPKYNFRPWIYRRLARRSEVILKCFRLCSVAF